jgi:hypothetical protein
LQAACEDTSRPDSCGSPKGYVSNNGQFSDNRYAFLFKPGEYENVSVSVGYYQQVLGLGRLPEDVRFTGSGEVFSQQASNESGALDTFWRGAENFYNAGSQDNMRWEVSQAASVRRAKTDGGFMAAGQGQSSGGFIADMDIGGTFEFGSQQQYIVRNSNVGSIPHAAVWNTVLLGTSYHGASNPCAGVGQNQWVEDNTPIIASKPFITFTDDKWELVVPAIQESVSGPGDVSDATAIDFDQVYVAAEGTSAADINSQLADCDVKAVVIAAGLFHLEETLQVKCAGTVVLGIGMPTLFAPADGTPAIETADVGGVRLAGLLVDPPTGGAKTDVMIRIGTEHNSGSADAPILLHDIYGRTGIAQGDAASPADLPSAKIMIEINSQHVIGDNLWLWRADHNKDGPVHQRHGALDHGLVVNGDHVTMYGLFAEHALKQQVLWNGENGRTFFYQSELPYDVEADWDFASYEVADNVQSHSLYGGGAYINMWDNAAQPSAGFKLPSFDMARELLTVWLNGNPGSQIKSVIMAGSETGGEAASNAHQGTPIAGPSETCQTSRRVQEVFI